jgi:hypothetical protein
MNTTSEFVKRAASRTGFKREFFVEKNLPTTPSNIVALPFYGDLAATFNISSMVLRQFKEKNPNTYLILCSWPGFQGLFPYVDEYWSLQDESTAKTLALGANNLYNHSNLAAEITRNLAEVMNVLTAKDLAVWYNNGFTKKYFDNFGQGYKRFLPNVPSSSLLSSSFLNEMNRKDGKKIVVFPATKMRSWQKHQISYLPVSKQFWETVLEELLKAGYTPVLYQNWFTYDMSREFTDRCVYLVPRSVTDVLAAMRHIGLVLDVHSGISRLAIAARSPFIAVDERLRYLEHHDCEIDDLCCLTPKRYIFSFSTLLMSGGPQEWKDSLVDHILVTLKSFDLHKDCEETNETFEEVTSSKVRQRTIKRLGLNFISGKLKEKTDGKCRSGESRTS